MNHTREIIGALTQARVQLRAAKAFIEDDIDYLADMPSALDAGGLEGVYDNAHRNLKDTVDLFGNLLDTVNSIRDAVSSTSRRVDNAERKANER